MPIAEGATQGTVQDECSDKSSNFSVGLMFGFMIGAPLAIISMIGCEQGYRLYRWTRKYIAQKNNEHRALIERAN